MSRPNVLLVILDSLRAANTSLHDYHRETTPFLEEYSNRATLYRQARSPGIHSVASHASMWTGAHVEQHQAIRHRAQLQPEATIWEELASEGYETGIFTENAIVAHASNLAEPFDTCVTTDQYVDKHEKLFPGAHGPADVGKHEGAHGNIRRCVRDDSTLKSLFNCVHHYYLKRKERSKPDPMKSPELIDQFLDWQAETNGPWSACLNLMDAHYPYVPEDEFDEWGGDELHKLHLELTEAQAREFMHGRPWWQLRAFESLYDGTIRQLDAYVEHLITTLEERGAHENTLIVITSDHGEGFGEVSRLTGSTKLIDHSWGIHEMLTHVPLVVKYPNQTDSHEIDDVASLTRFPEAVESSLNGSNAYDSFVPDGPVVSSTYRLGSEDADSFENSPEDIDDYLGPWRAVYEQSDSVVRKFAQKGGESIVLEILDAQHAYPVSRDGAETVENTFTAFDDEHLKEDEMNSIDADVENRLSDLGYLT